MRVLETIFGEEIGKFYFLVLCLCKEWGATSEESQLLSSTRYSSHLGRCKMYACVMYIIYTNTYNYIFFYFVFIHKTKSKL